MLLGCAGWPSGTLDVGSWAVRQGLAEVVIYQAQPGCIFQLDPEDGDFLTAGLVDPKLVDSFARRRRPLSEDAEIVALDGSTCEIRDARRGRTYRIVRSGDDLDVYVPENFESEEHTAAIRQFARRSGAGGRLLRKDRALSDAAREALVAVGGQFVRRLIDFAPHVVGFRLEGGDHQQIAGFVRAVRLFCGAEVVLGGPSATSHPREVLKHLGADYVFAGEAEETFARFLELAREHNSKDRAAEIPGLAYRYGGRTWHNTLPADGYERTVADVDGAACGLSPRCLRNLIRPVTGAEVLSANRLDYSLLDGFAREFDSLFFTGGRGCPGACTFCAKLHGQEVRVKSARQLLEEIEAADARVADGTIQVARYPLFEHTERPELQPLEIAWAAIYDEDFFLHRRRAIEFLELWDQSPLKTRYRLGFQTNPCTLLDSSGEMHGELLGWIDRLKPMIQVGAESLNQELLTRWRKRHSVEQLHAVLDALDRTRQDYAVFILLTDFDTTPEELVETLRLLVLGALPRRRMRIASSPFTIPLFDSQTRRLLEYRRMLTPERIRHFSDYERVQPGWMDPLAAELADLADSELRFALEPEFRDGALIQAFEVVLRRVEQEQQRAGQAPASSERRRVRAEELLDQARRAMDQIKEARFQGLGPLGP